MVICNLCKNELKKGFKYITNEETHICEQCISWCLKIVNDPKERKNKITYLNEYKEKMGA